MASASTHHDGGPSHNLHEAGDPHLFDGHEQHDSASPWPHQPAKNLPRVLFNSERPLGKFLEAAGIPKLSIPPLNIEESKDHFDHETTVELEDEQRRGLFVLGGILGGGWILGKLFS